MAKQKKGQTNERAALTGLERLGLRVTAMIQSPMAQLNRSVLIHRLDTDEDEAWDGVMGLLRETDGLHLLFDDEGNVLVSWDQGEEGDRVIEPEEIKPLLHAEEVPF
jgi:hypothetical protein